MSKDIASQSIKTLVKQGNFKDLSSRVNREKAINLANIFDLAVTDFRTVRRNTGHMDILRFCVDQGLDFEERAGWTNQPLICLAAMYGNNEIVAYMSQFELPDNPFIRTVVGDIDFIKQYAKRHKLSSLKDENDFNLVFYCAASALGRKDIHLRERLRAICTLLLQENVSSDQVVKNNIDLFPALLCAWFGGDQVILKLLLTHGKLSQEHLAQCIEFALEPHQRSGEPFAQIAETIVAYGFDLNFVRPSQGRTLLHGAANRGSVKAVQWLVKRGAIVDARDISNRTPLHVAAQRNTSSTVVKQLVNGGATVNMVDAAGNTPLFYAQEKKRRNVIEYLVSVGAI